MTDATAQLAEEYKAYRKMKSKLIEQGMQGKFALVKNGDLVGVYDSDIAAYTEGLQRFGNVPVLIMHISPEEETIRVPVLSLGLFYAGL